MPVARSTSERIPYVLERERELPKGEQTTFYLRAWPNRLVLQVASLASKDDHAAVEVSLLAGLAGWDGLRDESGAEVAAKFEGKPRVVHGVAIPNPLTESSFDLLEPLDLGELSQAVLRANRLLPDDVKN